MTQPRSSKRMRTGQAPPAINPDGSLALTPLVDYRYNPSNVFARMQSDTMPAMELLFNRPHTFAMLERSGSQCTNAIDCRSSTVVLVTALIQRPACLFGRLFPLLQPPHLLGSLHARGESYCSHPLGRHTRGSHDPNLQGPAGMVDYCYGRHVVCVPMLDSHCSYGH